MNKLISFLSIVALLMLTACGGATSIKPEKDTLSFPIDGGEETVSVSADGSWAIKDCPAWVDAEVQDSVLVIKTNRNETGSILQGDIVLSGKGDVEATISVTQLSKCTYIKPESDRMEFSKEGDTQTVNIDTDGIPKVDTQGDFSASFDNGTLTVTATANEGGERSGMVKLTCDDQIAIIMLTQEGNICPTCGGSGKVKCSACGGKGYIMYPVRSMDIAYEGCGSCGGSGYDDQGWFETQGTGINKGSGKMTCPTCGGSGQ